MSEAVYCLPSDNWAGARGHNPAKQTLEARIVSPFRFRAIAFLTLLVFILFFN